MSDAQRENALLGTRVFASCRNVAEAVGRSYRVVAGHIQGCIDKGWLVQEQYRRGVSSEMGLGSVAIPHTTRGGLTGFPTEAEVEEIVALGL
jgi:hypothetical protein